MGATTRMRPRGRVAGLLVHAYLAATLLPLWAIVSWFRGFEPGAGPQGGEAMFLLLVLFVLMWLPASLAGGLRAAGRGRRLTLRRVAMAAALWLAFWVVCIMLLFRLAELATSPYDPASTRSAATIAFAATGLALYAGNLWLLRRP